MAKATVASLKAPAQSATPTLDVRIVLDLRYLWLIIWKRAEAPSSGSGRYPGSSIYANIRIG
nr:hypothetical protein [Streptomyces sp. PKU-MA01144]